jgi:glycogen synthase kinase 3 beta
LVINITHIRENKKLIFSLIGYVFEAWDKVHKTTVAVKRTTKAGEYVSREFEVLDKLRECKNVIKLLDIYYSKNEEGKTAQNLIFEYCKTNLEEAIQTHKAKEKYLPIEEVREFMKQIFEGMKYVH